MSEANYPEVFCDFNARMTEDGYSLERNGSQADLAKLGITLARAVGKRFTFNGGGDAEDENELADILRDGVIAFDENWGYLAVLDADGFYHRKT